MERAVEAQGLRKSFGDVDVLRGVDFGADRGTVLALLGPNGAGKTTAVRILATLLRPDGGRAVVGGHDVVRDAHRVRSVIGLTGQFSAVDGLLTGRENLAMMGRLHHIGARTSDRRAAELLEQFDLVDAADRPVRTYSGGMRRRLDLAASLIAAPPILFLDEPTTGLDPRSRHTVWDTVRRLLADGVTVLLTTQYLEEADRLADRIAVLDGGTVIAEGTADQLKRRVGHERLTLTFDRPDTAATARVVLGGDALVDGSTVTIPVDGVRHVKAVLDRLTDAGVEIAAMTVASPTLDDVFLTLTGRAPATTEVAA